jgi:hypothetical protein
MPVLYILTKIKSLQNIVGVRVVGGKIALRHVANSNGMVYAIVVSIPAEKDRYILHTSPLIP